MGGAYNGAGDLAARIVAILDPRFKSLEETVRQLVSREEHEGAVRDLEHRIQLVAAEATELRHWRETRPTQSVSHERFAGLEADVRALQGQPSRSETRVRGWTAILLTAAGIGAAMACSFFGTLASMAVSIGIAVWTSGH